MTSTASTEIQPRLQAELQRALSAILHQSTTVDAAPQWRNDDAELLRRFLAAEHYESNFRALLTFAQADKPRLTADELTAEFLEQQDNGKLLRKASIEYAQAHKVDPKRARHLLLLAVNLRHYGGELLAQLRSGKISEAAAELAASKLKSIPEPNPKQTHAGTPWQPQDLEKAKKRAEDAKRKLGVELSDLAQHSETEGDFKAGAAKLRESHHPEPAHIRQAKARQKRYFRLRPVADGMAQLEGFLSASDAEQITRTLKAVTARRRATGNSKGLTSNQLMADAATDLLLGRIDILGKPDPVPRPQNTGEAPTQTAPAQAISGQHVKPIQPRIFLLMTLTEWVNLGGFLDPHRMGYLNKHYPQLYAQAERNRIFYGLDPGARRTNYPDGVIDSGASPTSIGSPHRLNTTDAARLTAHAAMLSVLLTDPISGYPLGTSKRVRRASPDVAELVTVRDQVCCYPGCQEPAIDCELDHVNEFADGGRTSYDNCARLCRQHHLAKSAGWLTVHPDPDQGDGALVFVNSQTDQRRYTQPALPLDPKAWAQYRKEVDQADPPPF